ncbi:NADPH:quinone reductase-like Zn-dependent oxidoreductase [Streptomyces sp. 846.5]|nr:NADP-dependent oxidoreductase [Streptomyces sp. 846.5]TDU05952.1 NADPH:quinone reductase-like Zn-dependent oxidoreductase [Streptomyces sp. 846.5]
MPRAVRFAQYGGVDVLDVVEVDRPTPGERQLLVKVVAAGINPGEAMIRQGFLRDRFPATFPSGQGSDLAGVVEELGVGATGFAVGDEVIGFTDKRASHAEYVIAEQGQLIHRPAGVPWEQAGALFVAGVTAYAAVRAVGVKLGDTVVVSGAAGGVGSLVVQLARHAGATVIGLAGESHHAWLAEHGALPVTYGEGAGDRIRAVTGGRVDAFIDTFGAPYIELALELGVSGARINTIIDFQGAAKHGTKADGSAAAASADVLRELAALIAGGDLEIPIAGVYRLDEVREAFRELERRHTNGKIVLKP